MVRLDPGAVVRLRASGDAVSLWAGTPFAVLVTTAARDQLAHGRVAEASEADPRLLFGVLERSDAVEVLDETALEAGGYGGILGVGKGSSRLPRLVRLSYTGAEPATSVLAKEAMG